MAVNGGKRKKNKTKKKKAKAADAQPRRSTLTPDQRLRVENMHEILGEVWEPFKTAAGAIRGLEADAAPWLELEFWDSLAEAFLRYFGKAITLQVDTAGLARAQREATKSKAIAQSFESSSNAETSTAGTTTANAAATVSGSHRRSSSGGGDRNALEGEGDLGGAVLPVSSEDEDKDNAVVTDQGGRLDGGQEEEEEDGDGVGLDLGAKRLEMLPMGAVGHLGRRDRLDIIRKTVPKEKRMVVLQRLFHLAQAPSEEVERLVASVKELKNNSSSTEIRDVNLLETWQGVREERATAWEDATEQVRLAAASVTNASPVSPSANDGISDDTTTAAAAAAITEGDVTVTVEGGDEPDSVVAAVPEDPDHPASSTPSSAS